MNLMEDQNEESFMDCIKRLNEEAAELEKQNRVADRYCVVYGEDAKPWEGSLCNVDGEWYCFDGTMWNVSKVGTSAVAEGFSNRYGADTKPEIGCTYMYDYTMYIYDGSEWVTLVDQDIAAKSGGSQSAALSPLTALPITDKNALFVTNSVTNHAISVQDGCNMLSDGIDIAQLAKDVAELKETLQKLLSNKTVPAEISTWDQAMEEVASSVAQQMVEEIDKDIMSFVIEEADKENDYDRAMGVTE